MNLEQIQTSEETEDQRVEIDIIDLGIDDLIEDLFLVKDELFVITDKKMLKICVRECPKKVEIKKTLEFELEERFKFLECIESKIHQSFYIHSYKSDLSLIIIYQYNPTSMQLVKKTKINKNFTYFKIDPEDPSIFYCYYQREKTMYKVSMETDSKEEDSRPDTEKTGKLEKKENKPLLEKRENKFIEKENSNLELFFYYPVNDIEDFSFDKDKKFFFTYYKKEIKKYDWKTKKLLHTFKGHEDDIEQLVFEENFSLMIR